ncbi:hypothetical protein CcaverHIS002_0300760 [Cutaneotrichosporon cavernicola]|uniref:GST N-terminal domain-containing protein n=1 Tax=Cutaneotrichosporon cavernicola TaxID=279322 RepID=A0AA48L1Q0_9TREE|nr:uncharacterized protein CcaverHIS019_0300750 [Cutaneotrichosporon cavernicola]BEI82208.1 hypothetical protein CcaverHIS002_0300760 [Cutaneotrichosporon cavernicola]BEI90005.1 hypothetical protein CcaverHIS019_0300750 [Cutaneotrichosporon cavernicola]BEI97777.1 hypothetical protein CcaverHIS631_0300760 [Cutaneotrichosporon cavernicola]BEJ05555.1 hypothetical protein CcaverHIS641_0300770 [Cutaneotrichosporon cavernicola]
MTDEMILYDIAMAQPRTRNVCSPNPWKARLALNLKSAHYRTIWVPLPSISRVRKSLNLAAGRKFNDGTDFYTLPILKDDALYGDSYDIALHLASLHGPDLFPDLGLDFKLDSSVPLLVPLTDVSDRPHPAYAKFNMAVDAAFTAHTGLSAFGFPFDPSTREATQAEFVRRASPYVTSWQGFELAGEARAKTLKSLEKTLGPLSGLYATTDGPFLGDAASYADCIVTAWLAMLAVTLPSEEWAAVRRWHGGCFGRLFDAMEPWRAVDEGTDWVA